MAVSDVTVSVAITEAGVGHTPPATGHGHVTGELIQPTVLVAFSPKFTHIRYTQLEFCEK